MPEKMQPVRLAGSVLNRSYHVCAFFHSQEEEYRVLMPFIKDGFEEGDRAFHVVDPVICTYDLSRFDASVVIDIMRTHPMVMMGGMRQENPFYVPPDEMLRELKERGRSPVPA